MTLLVVGPLVVLGLALLGLPGASAAPAQANRWRLKGQDCEKRGAWLDACRAYDEALRRDRTHAPTREAYQRCLRRLRLAMRHGDPGYRRALTKLQLPHALDAYQKVLHIVSSNWVERDKTDLTQLFQQGLQELRFALEEPAFREHQLAGQKAVAVNNFKARLTTWPVRKLNTCEEAREQVQAVLHVARREGLILRPALNSALVQEFTAGACNSLDMCSAYLTPGYLAAQAARGADPVGIGAELVVGEDERLQVGRLYAKGPAEEAGLARFDRLVRINRQPVEGLTADEAALRLLGKPGSPVEVEVVRPGDPPGAKRVFKMTRRAVAVPTVEWSRLNVGPAGQELPAGYLRIDQFRKGTAHEVRDALNDLKANDNDNGNPIQGLILDLRGNPGGLFSSGVAVAELFLREGIIAHTRGPLSEHNRSYRAEGPDLLQLPLVVLVDGDTASAAEVVAGALLQRRNTLVIGQTTYGKGSIQFELNKAKAPLDKLPGSIRLTVAYFCSPTNQPYHGRGVTPHETLPVEGEAALREARQRLYDLLTRPPAGAVALME
jgi:carboxyl-terminal processing protease